MDSSKIGGIIAAKRRALGLTQQALAEKLHISFQAVSKWENGTANPDIEMLPQIAGILGTTTDALLGYSAAAVSIYEARYQQEGYYWGLVPNRLCYEVLQKKPPIKPWRVLDIGCGEGKDAVFLARNGYRVSAFDISETGIAKAKALAEKVGVHVDFFLADAADYRSEEEFDIIYSSGVLHFVAPKVRQELFDYLKARTAPDGLHALNAFVEKPFIQRADDGDRKVRQLWKSGELFMYYHDWMFLRADEEIFDCNSGGIPHKHCMDILVAKRGVELAV